VLVGFCHLRHEHIDIFLDPYNGVFALTELEEYLSMFYEIAHRGDLMFRSTAAFVKKYGIRFTPQPLPKGFFKGEPQQCFRNCALHVIEGRDDLVYVEGYALSIIPIHHAWLVDAEGNVYDPTWRAPGHEYIGVPFNREFLCEMLVESGLYGLLDNYNLDARNLDEPTLFYYQGEAKWSSQVQEKISNSTSSAAAT
jgi:hypothetical protein